MKSTSNQRRLRAHKKRKARNQFWTAQPEPIQAPIKGRVKSDGSAHVRYIRNGQFRGGKSHIVGEPNYGSTWIRKDVR